MLVSGACGCRHPPLITGICACCAMARAAPAPVVSHDNDIGIIRHHPGGIGESLAFSSGGCTWIRETEGSTVESSHSTLKRESGTCARFIEERRKQFTAADPPPTSPVATAYLLQAEKICSISKFDKSSSVAQMSHCSPFSYN